MPDDSGDAAELLQRAGAGDQSALERLFAGHRARLERMVQLRLDQRMRGRVDPADVLQEAYLDAWKGLPDYVRSPVMPFFLWLRTITIRKLHAMHRCHLEVHARDAGREVKLDPPWSPEATSEMLAAQLLGRHSTPSRVAIRAEMKARLLDILNAMAPIDREVLALRHFEELSNVETAQVLGIRESAASNRYVRALERLKEMLQTVFGRSDL